MRQMSRRLTRAHKLAVNDNDGLAPGVVRSMAILAMRTGWKPVLQLQSSLTGRTTAATATTNDEEPRINADARRYGSARTKTERSSRCSIHDYESQGSLPPLAVLDLRTSACICG